MDNRKNPPKHEGDRPARVGQPWTVEEERQLYDAVVAGSVMADLAKAHDRAVGDIWSRLRALGLVDGDGNRALPWPPPFVATTPRTIGAFGRPRRRDRDGSPENRMLPDALRRLTPERRSTAATMIRALALLDDRDAGSTGW